jgi:hypothetical protein
VASSRASERYLERLVSALEALRAIPLSDLPGADEVARSRLAHAGGVLEAFFSVGLLDDVMMRTWWERVWRALGLPPPSADPPYLVVRAGPPVSAGGTVTARAPSAGPRMSSIPQLSEPGRFLRLVAASQPGQPSGGLLHIVGVEVYEHGVAVLGWSESSVALVSAGLPGEAVDPSVWRAGRADRLDRFQDVLGGLRLTDDASTAYTRLAAASTTDRLGLHWRVGFTPGVPAGVSTLFVDADGGQFAVSLS